MPYNKYIVSGDMLETYSYEREPAKRISKGKRRSASADAVSDLAIVGSDDISAKVADPSFTTRRESNSRRAKMAFRRLVLSNIDEHELPFLLTLTYAANQKNLRIGYADFKSFVGALRYKYSDDWRYIAVPEFQKRGAVHFHALIWGIPASVFELERSTRFLASLWGKGFVYVKETYGNEGIAIYLSKYMQKAFTDPRFFSHRTYTVSKNCRRSEEVVIGSMPLASAFEYIDLSTGTPLRTADYMTKWLGRAVYKRYKIIRS
jgi:hypothetical protein